MPTSITPTPASKSQNDLNRWLNSYFASIIAAVLVIFLLSAYWLVIAPKISQTRETIQINLDQQQNLYLISRRKLTNLEALSEMYQKINPADLQKFNAVLPDSYPPEKLFGEIAELLSRGGWLISEISLQVSEEDTEGPPRSVDPKDAPSASRQINNLERINIVLKVETIDYAGFKRLLGMIETNLRLLDVSELEFFPSDRRANFILTTYYYKKLP